MQSIVYFNILKRFYRNKAHIFHLILIKLVANNENSKNYEIKKNKHTKILNMLKKVMWQ